MKEKQNTLMERKKILRIRGKKRVMGLGRTYKGQARENVICVEYLPNDKRQGWRKIKGKWYKFPQEVTGGR